MDKLYSWLSDRKRKYADGLSLFRELAPEEMKKKYLTYFSEVQDAPQFDSHYTVLVNKLSSVARMAGAKPQRMKSETVTKALISAVNVAKAVDKAVGKVEGDKVLKRYWLRNRNCLHSATGLQNWKVIMTTRRRRLKIWKLN
ncbi:MAG: hypothetical protein LUH63_20460 [Parabacteroides sp.]|nr:hypothetical protein [Parabacteroides sp.]